MESLSKLKNKIDVDKILEKGNLAKNMVRNLVMNYSETEAKVIDATNNEAWGPSSTLMQEISKLTYQYEDFDDVVNTIYRRLIESGEIWRQIYKALILLEYLIKNGSERVVESAKDHIYEIKSLMTYQHVDEKGKDQGLNVRNRAKEIILLLNSNDRIREERAKAKANRDKYTAVSSQSRYSGHSGHSSSYRSSSRYDDYQDRYDDYPGSKDRYDDEYKPHSTYDSQYESNYDSNRYDSNYDSNYDSQYEPQTTQNDDFGEMAQAKISTTEAVQKIQFSPNTGNNSNTFVPTIQPPTQQQQSQQQQQPKQQQQAAFQPQQRSKKSQDDFGDFADFSSFTPSTTTNIPVTKTTPTTTTTTTTTTSLADFVDFHDFQSPPTSQIQPQYKQQTLDPFGDPFGSIPTDHPLILQPENSNKPISTQSVPNQSNNNSSSEQDKFGLSGLVDLSNLKKYDSGKKEQKVSTPMGQMKPTQTTSNIPPMNNQPMYGNMNQGMNQPMYGNMNQGMYGNMGQQQQQFFPQQAQQARW